MNVIQRMWKDPVGANVIAGIILLVVGAAWASLSGLSWSSPVSIPRWLVAVWGALSAFAALYIFRTATDKPAPSVAPEPVRASKETKIVTERLSEQCYLRFTFAAAPGFGEASGQDRWSDSYLKMFRILGPKLMAGVEEAEVKRYLDRVLKDESVGKYYSLHILDADFQTMKVRLQALGLVTLTPNQGKLQWALTDGAHEMLHKLSHRPGK